MGSQRPRAIQLSGSTPPPGYDTLEDMEDEGEPAGKAGPEPLLNVLGSVKEKGFSGAPVAREKISFPQPRVTAFPVARHRSDGPHWGPSKPPLHPDTLETDVVDEGMPGVAMAEPLRRRPRENSETSKWRSNRKSNLNVSLQTQNEFDDKRQRGDATDMSTDTLVKRDDKDQQAQDTSSPIVESSFKEHASGNVGISEEVSNLQELSMGSVSERDHGDASAGSKPSVTLRQPATTSETLASNFPRSNDELSIRTKGAEVNRGDAVHAKAASESVMHPLSSQDIDGENRNAVLAMNPAEVAEAQAELEERFSAKTLEFLRKRGAAREEKRLIAGGPSTSMLNSTPRDNVSRSAASEGSQSPAPHGSYDAKPAMPQNDAPPRSKPTATVRGTTVGPADLLTDPFVMQQPSQVRESSQDVNAAAEPPATNDPWTLRVEAVRSMKFDLDGNVMARDESHSERGSQPVAATGSEGMSDSRDKVNLPALERDFLRMEGDPVGSGYSISDALALARSTVPGQRAAALRLIASVLEKAESGLQNQKERPSNLEDTGNFTDWQAVWAYALGPEAQLVLTLRLLLDNGHATVVAACARALQALLSYTANENYFQTLEGLWPGDKVMFTGPIFRRKTKQDEGFVGAGRWKTNVKETQLFPFSSTGEEIKDEDGDATVGDDGHVSNLDVAAGLIRMGILPRIRYILEVDRLMKAEDGLLRVLICLARHSSATADAVMSCPRLIETVVHRFIGVDGRIPKESYGARSKAIRLVKVLCLARRSYCLHFEAIGSLQAVVRSTLQQGYVNILSEQQDTGFYETVIEAIRFWRVCVDYGIGVSLYADCYPTICFWQAPLVPEEILGTANDERLWMATESYLLLEHIARTLPWLHPSIKAKKDVPTWSWSVAIANVNTALKLMSPDCIRGIHVLLDKYVSAESEDTVFLDGRLRNTVGAVAAALHFLATVCERIVSDEVLETSLEDPEEVPLEWLPNFLPELGLGIARSGLLKVWPRSLDGKEPQDPASPKEVETIESNSKYSFVECLAFCSVQADEESAIASINFASGLIRMSSIVDRLICISRPKGIPAPDGQPVEYKVLENGLLRSADADLKTLSLYCRNNVMTRSKEWQVGSRGGPAPGLGIGWGSVSGGAWSKSVLVAQYSARLALELLSPLSVSYGSHTLQSRGENQDETEVFQRLFLDSFSRLEFGLLLSFISNPINRNLAYQAISNFVLHPSSISDYSRRVQNFLRHLEEKESSKRDPQRGNRKKELAVDSDRVSKLLIQHFKEFWLAGKEKKINSMKGVSAPPRSRRNGVAGAALATVDEEEGNNDSVPPAAESLSEPWVGQRLPVPRHWFLSSLVNKNSQSTQAVSMDLHSQARQKRDREEVIEAGLLLFLGFELELASASEVDSRVEISLARKVHSLSCVFLSEAEIFFEPQSQELIEALQCVMGDQIEKEAGIGLGDRRQTDSEASRVGETGTAETSGSEFSLDFENSIDPSYVIFAEALADQFVATSFGNLAFGRQIALYLCAKVPDTIRLATWRVLGDGKVLDLLPPLNQCCGPAQIYLNQDVKHVSQEIINSFLSAWASGALDRAAKRDALSFTLALHNVALFLFSTVDTQENTPLLRKNAVRLLLRSTVGKLEPQEMLAALLSYKSSRKRAASAPTDQADNATWMTDLDSRVEFMTRACDGAVSLTNEIKRAQSFLSANGSYRI